MGLYDRDYGRFESQTPWDRVQRSSRSMTITLLVITIAVFFVDILFAGRDPSGNSESRLLAWFAVSGYTLVKPWLWFQFLTYGFMHDTSGIHHILFNMIGLFFFGRAVEQRMGSQEFLRFYLVAIVIGGIVGAIIFWVRGVPGGSVIGASGAVIATTILFACYYPHAEILLMFVIPIKAWIVAVMFVAFDLYGAVSSPESSNTAFEVHLSGAGFALLYYFRHWNLRWLDFTAIGEIPERMRARSRRMKLKIHDPDKKLQKEADDADRILEKIHQSGESSLTSAERKTLERYSRRQREKRDP